MIRPRSWPPSGTSCSTTIHPSYSSARSASRNAARSRRPLPSGQRSRRPTRPSRARAAPGAPTGAASPAGRRRRPAGARCPGTAPAPSAPAAGRCRPGSRCWCPGGGGTPAPARARGSARRPGTPAGPAAPTRPRPAARTAGRPVSASGRSCSCPPNRFRRRSRRTVSSRAVRSSAKPSCRPKRRSCQPPARTGPPGPEAGSTSSRLPRGQGSSRYRSVPSYPQSATIRTYCAALMNGFSAE